MTAAGKLRQLLAARPAMPNTEQLVSWWRTSAELVPQVLAELDVLKQEVRELEQQRDALRAVSVVLPSETFEHGLWRPCSGCHESDEGHPTGPYSETFRCNLGSGCHECGGIGATWEQFVEVIAGADLNVGDKQVPVTVVGRTADGLVRVRVEDPAMIAALKNSTGPVSIGYVLGEPAVPADDESRCAVCGWPMVDPVKGAAACRPGDCSRRPRPEKLYAPEREKREAEELHERALLAGMPPSGRWA